LIQVTRTKKINRHEEIISKSTRPMKKGAWWKNILLVHTGIIFYLLKVINKFLGGTYDWLH